MTPIEYSWIIVIALFGVVGIVRTYSKELGVTTMCVAGSLLLLQFGDTILDFLGSQFGTEGSWLLTDRFAAAFLIVVFLIIVFISYQGITLVFKGTPPSGYVSHVLGALVGLINGYFITGTVWFYLHQYGYPFGLIDGNQLSDAAQRMLNYLPPSIFGEHPGYLLGLLIILLILSVWR